MEQGKLYLCATPIGNLKDMTARCIEILKEVDLIAAEDTRNSIKLLNHFDIHTKMTAYHEYNRFEKADELVEEIKSGKNVACITDAGTPGISDPGEVLVKKCVENDIEVCSIPGATACISALILSGLSTRRFRFEGFLPKDKKERGERLKSLENDTATMIFYEAPHHLVKTLEDLLEAFGNRKIAFCKELTKLHESIERCSIEEGLQKFKEQEPKGEFVLVIEGQNPEKIAADSKAQWEKLSIDEHLFYYENQGLDRKEAMKKVAKDRGVSKREIYNETMKK